MQSKRVLLLRAGDQKSEWEKVSAQDSFEPKQ